MTFLKKLPLRIFLWLSVLLVIFPLAWSLIASLKTNTEIISGSFWSLPASPQWDNYARAWTKANMGSYMSNSILVLALSMLFMMVLAVPTSYTLTRFKFLGSKAINTIYMLLLFVQAQYIIVPLFIQVNRLKMGDNLVALSLIYAVSSMSFAIMLLSGFMRSIPQDFEEAAMIDGCGRTGTLLRIIVPMCGPGMVTVAMLQGLTFWNEYILALVLIYTETKLTLPVGLLLLNQTQKYAADWGALYAGLAIVLLPTILIFALCQDKLTQGMSVGGLKG